MAPNISPLHNNNLSQLHPNISTRPYFSPFFFCSTPSLIQKRDLAPSARPSALNLSQFAHATLLFVLCLLLLYRRSSSSTARSRVTLVCSEVRGRSISAHISANFLRTQLTHQLLHSSANASSCAATAECVLPLVHFFLSQAWASSDRLSSSLATNVQNVPLSSGVSTLQAPRKRCKFIAPLPTSPLPLCPTSPGRHPSERPKFFYVIFASPSY